MYGVETDEFMFNIDFPRLHSF